MGCLHRLRSSLRARGGSECSSEATGLSERALQRRTSQGQEARNLPKVSPPGNARTGAPKGDGGAPATSSPHPQEGRGPGTLPLGSSRPGREVHSRRVEGGAAELGAFQTGKVSFTSVTHQPLHLFQRAGPKAAAGNAGTFGRPDACAMAQHPPTTGGAEYAGAS